MPKQRQLTRPPDSMEERLKIQLGIGDPNSPTLKGPLIGKRLDLTHTGPKKLSLLEDAQASRDRHFSSSFPKKLGLLEGGIFKTNKLTTDPRIDPARKKKRGRK